MSNISDFSTTASSNNAASPNGFPEGMAPSGLNDSARELMAAVAKQYQDTDGGLVTTGTGTAYVLATNSSHATLASQGIMAFRIHTINTGSATLNVDTLGAKTMNMGGAALVAGALPQDSIVVAVYNATNDVYDILTHSAVLSGTLLTAAQPNVTSLGTLTALQVDNLNLNGNTLSSTAGTDLNITPLAGQQIVLDGAIVVDAGVVTGATSITSTAFVGDLTGNADTVTTNANLTGHITSVGNAAVLGSFTKAQLDTAISDGTVAYSGGAFHDGFSDFVANEHIDWTSASNNFATSGSLSCGTFTSTGIDDNATATAITIDSSQRIAIGATSQVIGSPIEIVGNSSGLALAVRGRASDNIGEIQFHPNASASLYTTLQSTPTLFNILMGAGGAKEYEFSATQLDLQSNNLVTAGSISGAAITSTGGIGVHGESAQAQASHITDASDLASAITAINAALVVLENVGLVAKT